MRIISLAATHRLHVVFELARRTTTPTSKLLFQVTGGFSEFERSMIRQRLNAGLSVRPRSSATATSRPKEVLYAGTLGRPGAEPTQIERARQELAKGVGIGKLARLTGLGTGTVHKLKREMAASM